MFILMLQPGKYLLVKIDLEKCCVSEVKKTNMLTTFPAQALPCSGSTGIISAGLPGQHPEELITLIVT
jgi:hypothetical protein